MKPIHIFRHVECEGPGYLAEVLAHYSIPVEHISIDQNEPVPRTLPPCSGLVFMGGTMSVNDPLPWVSQELDLIRQAVARDIPVLGHCLGGQLISKALQGKVSRNPVREIGWLPVDAVPGSASAEWLTGLETTFEVFHWHGEQFSIPPGATRILGSADCPNQAFVVGNTLALQFHVEMTAAMVTQWADAYSHELTPGLPSVQERALLVDGLEQKITRLHQVADVLYGRWLRPILMQ